MSDKAKTDAQQVAEKILQLRPDSMDRADFSRLLLQLSVQLVTIEMSDDEAENVFYKAALPIVKAVTLANGSFDPLPQLAGATGPAELN